jgi:hypothetical protein
MNFFNKPPGPIPRTPQRTDPAGAVRPAVAMARANASAPQASSAAASPNGRLSNGLKEFLWQLNGIGHPHLLDLGPARQTTITFFIERGFKVYTEDFLATLKRFQDEDAQWLKSLPPDADRSERSPGTRAERFLEATLKYSNETFDAVLVWDILDYLDSELMARLAARITSLVREGGVVFAMFHQRKPETFHRYRILDAQNLELIPAPCPFQPQRVFQNREISNLFCRYRSSKMFVGRDQIRESLFVK